MAEALQPDDKAHEAEHDKLGDALRDEILTDFLANYRPKNDQAPQRDIVEGQYNIILSEPLPQFNTQHCKAYAVRDELDHDRNMYALVCASQVPYRGRIGKYLRHTTHPHMVNLVGSGTCVLSTTGHEHFVLIYERPRGKSLRELLAEQTKPLPDSFIVERILGPLAMAVSHLQDAELSHGRINPDNIFYGEYVMLGECCSEPCGYSQDPYFESLERLECSPAGKGEGTTTHDYYALGVLAVWLRFGNAIFKGLNPQEHLERLIRDGSYQALASLREFSEHMTDFIRGTLNDNRYERWGFPQIKTWMTGRRFNVLPPSIPSTGSRAFPIGNDEHTNFRSLANAMYTQWDKAASLLRDGSITRWVELSARRKDVAELITKSIRSLGGEAGRNDRQNNELVARCIIIMDPASPMRMREIGAFPDGLGTLLADLYRENQEHKLQYVAEIIEQGLTTVWSDMQKKLREENLPMEMSNALWLVDRIRIVMRTPGIGFGLERCLYDMNPELPCQSPLLAGNYISSLQQILRVLDSIAITKARGEDMPMDRHIAAYITSRTGLLREVTLPEFDAVPGLAKHKGLIALKLLQAAQEKSGNIRLPGLSNWVALQLIPMIEHFYSRSLRKQLFKGLRQVASSGMLLPMLEFLHNKQYLVSDQQGFHSAVVQYHTMGDEIANLKDEDVLRAESYRVGNSLAKMIAYSIFLGVLIITLTSHQ